MKHFLRFGKLGSSPVVDFAVQELAKYLKQMDPDLSVDILQTDTLREDFQNLIWVGLDPSLAAHVPSVQDPALDDAIAIHVEHGRGYITGSNERSVLLAVYRFLRELGCYWVRPGAERIPQKSAENICICLKEAAASRHRGVCIEGSITYENAAEMIDFLPKIGMNAYYIQFFVPETFFDRWYNRNENPYLHPTPATKQEIEAMTLSLETEIARRGLLYHKTGHGWTCEPFGIDGGGWFRDREHHIPEETRQYLAQLEGQRQLFRNVPLNTNLCYSDPKVRKTMVDAMVDYCRKNKNVHLLHFWLADGSNNHCECDECAKKRPADWYVMMLNALDDALTVAGLDTKIVFLIYYDLLWEPLEEKLHSSDRFVLMFAPISRNYGQNYRDFLTYDAQLPPYVRNRLDMPKSLDRNLAHLRKWQAQFRGDSFVYDYHLMWAHVGDPGYEACAKNLFEDMTCLKDMDLGGMISCQLQRSFFPTAMPMQMMAAALWDRTCSYEEKAAEYYLAAYSEDGSLVQQYLQKISHLFDLYNGPAKALVATLRRPLCRDYAALQKLVENFRPVMDRHTEEEWTLLRLHSEYVLQLAHVLQAADAGTYEEAICRLDAMMDWLYKNELPLQRVFDLWNIRRVLRIRLNPEKNRNV